MKTLTYGTLPTFLEIEAAFNVECPDGLYEVGLPRSGTDFANLNAAGLLVRDDGIEGIESRYTAVEMAHSRNTYFYTAAQLYRLLENLTELHAIDSDEPYADWAGDFASSILTTLGFEWV